MMSQDNCTLRSSHPEQKLEAFCHIIQPEAVLVIVLHSLNNAPVAPSVDCGRQYVCSYYYYRSRAMHLHITVNKLNAHVHS